MPTQNFVSAPPIVICSTTGTSLPVLLASIAAYVPVQVAIYLAVEKPVETSHLPQQCIILPNKPSNFGDAYNAAVDHALSDGHKSVIIANDDVVLTPSSYSAMVEDVNFLHELGYKVGVVGSRSDYVMGSQNIRVKGVNDTQLENLRWPSEYRNVMHSAFIAPIFAWLSADAFSPCRFPPINWYSDHVICHDLSKQGFQHFVSRSYVHHVGSQTIGLENQLHHDAAYPWVKEHRPSLAKQLFGEEHHA